MPEVSQSELKAAKRVPRWAWAIIALLFVLVVLATLLVNGRAEKPLFTGPQFLNRTGAWTIDATTSQLDGTKTYRALLQSDNSSSNIIGQPERAVLGFDCGKDGITAGISWPNFVRQNSFDDPHAAVGWRIDSGPIHRETWLAADKMTALKGAQAAAFLQQVAGAGKLVVSAPGRGDNEEATFSLAGLQSVASAIGNMRCG